MLSYRPTTLPSRPLPIRLSLPLIRLSLVLLQGPLKEFNLQIILLQCSISKEPGLNLDNKSSFHAYAFFPPPSIYDLYTAFEVMLCILEILQNYNIERSLVTNYDYITALAKLCLSSTHSSVAHSPPWPSQRSQFPIISVSQCSNYNEPGLNLDNKFSFRSARLIHHIAVVIYAHLLKSYLTQLTDYKIEHVLMINQDSFTAIAN